MQVLATNKVASICGTSAAAATYHRRIRPDPRTFGPLMGACNLAGGYLGARTAVEKGSRFVRVFFLVVVSAFIVRIGGDVFGAW